MLIIQVDWDAEQPCFETFARECSRFYAMKPDPFTVEDETGDADEDGQDTDMNTTDSNSIKTDGNNSGSKSKDSTWKWTVEHVLFPVLRSGLVPPKRFADDGTLLQIANLPDLYKVFERC